MTTNDDLSGLARHDTLAAHLDLAYELIDSLDETARTTVRAHLQRAKKETGASRRRVETRVRASAAANERLEQEQERVR